MTGKSNNYSYQSGEKNGKLTIRLLLVLFWNPYSHNILITIKKNIGIWEVLLAQHGYR
jgi:hypothetical protein